MDKSEFFLIVIDEDRKLFTVEGPLIDDQPFKSAIETAKYKGRTVRCCNIGSTCRCNRRVAATLRPPLSLDARGTRCVARMAAGREARGRRRLGKPRIVNKTWQLLVGV
jgi:hypothetical protein